MNRLRLTELAAHCASFVAVVATLFVVSVVPGAETNPVSAAIIAEIGLVGWAVGTPVAVAGIFAALRWARRRTPAEDLVQPRHFGVLFTAGVSLDALTNAYAIATHATSWSVNWQTLVVEAGTVALLALVLVVRPNWGVPVDELLSAARGVTSRLSAVDRRAAAAVGFSVLVVLSISAPALVLVGTEPVDADHGDGDDLIEDFESGSTDGTYSGPINVSSTNPIEGSYSAYIQGDGGSTNYNLEYSGINPSTELSYSFRVDDDDSGSSSRVLTTGVQGPSGTTLQIWINNDMSVSQYAGGVEKTVASSISLDTVYRARIEMNNSHFRTILEDESGSQVASGPWQSKANAEDPDYVDFATDRDNVVAVDYIAKDGKGLGQPVDGTVTDGDGNGIDSATVELRQSGSVQKSTTTSSDGSYSFSGVSDGDYSVRASASGYQNSSKSVTVAGSPKTIDLTLSATNPPYVSSADPRSGFLNMTGTSTTLTATVKDDEGDAINATIYYNDGSGGDGYQQVASVTQVSSGTDVTATVSPEFGIQQKWKVNLSDGANSLNSSVYTFQPPGKLTALNGTDFTTVDGTTVTVNLNATALPWTDSRTTNDGQVNLTGLPQSDVEADISASGYDDQSIIIYQRSGVYFPVLYESGEGYEQCFELRDFTGNYNADETYAVLQQKVDGEYEDVASSDFSATGEACFTLKDGEQYRVVVRNDDGDQRTTGDYRADDNETNVTVPIYDRGDDGVQTTLYSWDAYFTQDSNGERDDISWSLDLVDNVSATNVTLEIYQRGNQSNVIHNQTIGVLGTGANASHLELLDSKQENKSWVVHWTATVESGNNTTRQVSGRKVLGAAGADQWPSLPDWMGHYGAFLILLMTGASVTRADVKAGLIMVPALAGLLWFTGMLSDSVLTGGGVALALGVGILLAKSASEDPV